MIQISERLRRGPVIDQADNRESMDPRAWLVAHRGWPDRYPENSLEGLQAVLEAGARQVEFDVQISRDGQAMVIHDDDLSRLTGRAVRVTDSTRAELQALRVRSSSGATAAIPTLDDTLALLGLYPDTTAFVELKRHSIDRHGLDRSVRCLLQILARAPCRVVLISFRWRALRRARQLGSLPVGWVFKPWWVPARILAGWLQPDYLFVRADRIPGRTRPFWPGPWQWVVYGVHDLDQARDLRARGADLIEVDDLPALAAAGHPQAGSGTG